MIRFGSFAVVGKTGLGAILLAAFGSLMVVFSAVAESDSGPRQVLEIGWIGPLTGGASVLGADANVAVQMAFDELNGDVNYRGPKLTLVSQDDQYETAKTLSAYDYYLVNSRGVRILFVYTYSGLFSIAKQAERDGVLLLDPLDCDEDIAKLPANVICVAKMTEALGVTLAKEALRLGHLPTAMLFVDNDAFPLKAATSSKEEFVRAGSPPVIFDGYGAGYSDFRSHLLKVKQGSVRALFLLGYSEVGLALKQARELGLNLPIYSLANVVSPDIANVAGEALEGVTVANWRAARGARFEAFIKQFVARRGTPPVLEISTIPSYDVARLIGDAVQGVSEVEQGNVKSKVQEFLYSVANYSGVSGNITIGADGVTRSFALTIQHVKERKLVD